MKTRKTAEVVECGADPERLNAECLMDEPCLSCELRQAQRYAWELEAENKALRALVSQLLG